MSQSHFIKIKTEEKTKKIFFPLNFNDLLGKINEVFLPNNDPNKIYQIYDLKNQKFIKDENDFIALNTEHCSDNKACLFIKLIDKNEIDQKPNINYQAESSSIFFESSMAEKKKEEEKGQDEKNELTEEQKIKESLRSLVQSKLKNYEKNIYDEIINNYLPIHKGINCNECGMNNIKGIRYKCTTC
jgi:hypothetical protein